MSTTVGRERRLFLLGALALSFCSKGEIHFTPDEDSDVMKRLELHFSGTDGAELTLCEDRTRADPWKPDGSCQEVHVVKGGGRGVDHTEQGSGGVGCGGCPFAVVAYVKGTWRASASAEPVTVEGGWNVGDLYDTDEIFRYPYRIHLQCKTTGAADCPYLHGALQADGTLEVTVSASSASEHTVRLVASGASTCPATP